jgi:outer membrane biogenesis lipoprotein LolB
MTVATPVNKQSALDREHRPLAALAALLLAGAMAAQPVTAADEVPAIFVDADLEFGEELIQEHKCDACHIRRFGGDGSAIYRPGQRLTTAGFLRGMVEQCNTELNLQMFPDEVTSVAAVLNRDHYHFKK